MPHFSTGKSSPESIPLTDKLIARFWAKVQIAGPDECWIWTGSRIPLGYGKMNVRVARLVYRQEYAHRISDLIANGPIPQGIHICHTCDNPPCVNPQHLFRGTAKDNMQDRERKGRGNRRRAPEYSREAVARMASDYQNGATLRDLRDAYGVSINTARRLVSDVGVTIRPTGQRPLSAHRSAVQS